MENKIDMLNITLKEVVTHNHMYISQNKCLNSVDYKYSVQEYTGLSIVKTEETLNILASGRIVL